MTASLLEAWRNWTRRFHKPLLAAALAVFGAGTVWAIDNLGISVDQIHAPAIALLIALSPLTLAHSALGLQLMAWGADTSIPFSTAIKTSAVAILAEALPLPGGAIVRTGALMKAGAGLGQGSAMVILAAVLWIALGALGAGIAFLGVKPTAGWALAGLGLTGSALSMGWLWRKAGWRLALLMMAHRLSGIGLIAVRLYLAFAVVGAVFPLIWAMPFVLATIAGSAAAIAPAGLGVSEGLAAVAAPTVGVLPAAAFLAVGIDRIVYLLLSAIVAFHSLLNVASKRGVRQATEGRAPYAPRLAVWGTFDTGKPRVRMIIEAACRIDPELTLASRNPWEGIQDKSQVTGHFRRLKLAASWLTSYPSLLYSYARMPKHDIVIVPYLGNIDVLLLWPFARLRGAKICWDMFISLYDTVVEDRQLVSASGLRARLLYCLERMSIRAVDLVLMDTREHARYVAMLYKVPESAVLSVWVGAETGLFRKVPLPLRDGPVHVLFYGQFIPLHGLATLVEAIHLIQLQDELPEMQFTIVGSGQDATRIDRLIDQRNLRNTGRIAWVNYDKLPQSIAGADICLGIFAGEGKAARVIPNKVFQILASGRPLVTRDGPAIRELVGPNSAIRLVQPDDPTDLASQLVALSRDLRDPDGVKIAAGEAANMPSVDVETIAGQLRACLETLE